jgi:hypothetical protein
MVSNRGKIFDPVLIDVFQEHNHMFGHQVWGG